MISSQDLIRNWFFKGFERAEVEALLALGREATYKREEKILMEGDPAEFFYILVQGSIAIKMKAREHGEIVLSTLREPGEIFGWSALVEEGRSTATAECLEKSTILSIKKRDAEELFAREPKLGYRFMKRLASLISRRLENTRALLMKGID